MTHGKKKRIIVKIGTGVLTSGVGQLDTVKMGAICKQVSEAKRLGYQVALVSSGAVGLGMGKLGLKVRPRQISAVQKCAAVGQGILIRGKKLPPCLYENALLSDRAFSYRHGGSFLPRMGLRSRKYSSLATTLTTARGLTQYAP